MPAMVLAELMQVMVIVMGERIAARMSTVTGLNSWWLNYSHLSYNLVVTVLQLLLMRARLKVR